MTPTVRDQELVTAGSIIVRQRGTRFHPGPNVGMGLDYTLYAKVDGRVAFRHKSHTRREVMIIPVAEGQ